MKGNFRVSGIEEERKPAGKKKVLSGMFSTEGKQNLWGKDASDKTQRCEEEKDTGLEKRNGHLEKRKRQERNRLTQHQQT